MSADNAAAQLRSTLTDTIDRQREVVRQRLAGKSGVVFAPLRWLLTIGALLWFPLVQPVLQTLLDQDRLNWDLIHQTHELVVLVVRIFSVNELLQNLTFLTMYFFLLWVILRWDTQRRIARFVKKWKSDSSDLSLTAQTLQWLDDLLIPVQNATEKVESLNERRRKFRQEN